MKKLLSIILGIMIFMVPLTGFAVTVSQGSYTTGKWIVVRSVNASDNYIWYLRLDGAADTLLYNSSTKRIYPKLGETFDVAHQYQSGTTLYPYPNSNDVNVNIQNVSDVTISSGFGFGNNATVSFLGGTCNIVDFNTNSSVYTPEPEMFAHQVNPGDYVRFTKPPGYTAADFDILVSFEVGNEPKFNLQNFFSDNTMKEFTIPRLLFNTEYTTTDHIDLKLIETRRNEPITVNTIAPMEKLATNGEIPQDALIYATERLDDSPNKCVIKNSTPEPYYITVQRIGNNGSESTQIQIENMSGGYYVGTGVSLPITDLKAHSFKVTPGERITIVEKGSSGTTIRYPVTEGFNVAFYTDTVPFQPLPGTPVPVEDLPGYIDDGVADPPAFDAMPDDVVGMLKWMSTQVLSFLAAMGESLTGIFEFLARFGAVFGSISFLPPQFTIAFTALIIVSLALRVVGR